VINPASGQSIDIQKSAAINAGFQLSPGQPWPGEGSIPGSQTSPTSSLTSQSISTKSRRLSGGAVTGIVIGILLSIVLPAVLIYVWWFKGRKAAPKNPTDVSAPLKDEEETIPIAYDRSTPSVQSDSGRVSPIASPPPLPLRLRPIRPGGYYDYPREKPPIEEHPAFRLDSSQGSTSERDGNFERVSG
jgi:hypothetical protein